MKHKDKIRIAKSLPRNADDEKYRRGKFDTDAWLKRKRAIAGRVARQQAAAHQRAVLRKQAKRAKTA